MFLLIFGIVAGVGITLGGLCCALNPEKVERLADTVSLRSHGTFEERVRGQRVRGWVAVPFGVVIVVISVVNFAT